MNKKICINILYRIDVNCHYDYAKYQILSLFTKWVHATKTSLYESDPLFFQLFEKMSRLLIKSFSAAYFAVFAIVLALLTLILASSSVCRWALQMLFLNIRIIPISLDLLVEHNLRRYYLLFWRFLPFNDHIISIEFHLHTSGYIIIYPERFI